MAQAADDVRIHGKPEAEEDREADTQQAVPDMDFDVLAMQFGMVGQTPKGFVKVEAPLMMARWDETADKTLDNLRPLLVELLTILRETYAESVAKAIDAEREEDGKVGLDA